MSKYLLVKNKDTNKKQVLFNVSFSLNNRDDFNDFSYYTNQAKLGLLGLSKHDYFNKILSNKNYEIVDFVSVPCGICYECLKSNSRDWATRIMLEASQYDYNYFLTITYDDEHLPQNQMLVKRDLQDFNKKLKIYLERKNIASDFRFYAVGEYGSTTARPHYHSIMFNLKLDDLKYYSKTPNGDYLFTSELLNKVWNKGFIIVGEVSVGSACYVARYCDKKRRLNVFEKKELLDKGIVPEFSLMSRRPGIGANYLETSLKKYIDENITSVYLKNGQIASLPLYFIKKLKENMSEEQLLKFNNERQFSSNLVLYDKLAQAEYAQKDIFKLNIDNSCLHSSKKRLL